MGQPTVSTRELPPHVARGIAVTLILGPLTLFGAALVLLAAVSMFISGLDPRAWFSSNAADWAFGTGIAGDGVNFVRFMLGGAMVTGGSAGIRWGFHGADR